MAVSMATATVPPPAGGKISGFIRPPPGIREVVEKTAAFVARGGPEFETKIRASDTTGKFNFLNADHPYNAYYKHKITELQAGTKPAEPATAAAGESAAAAPESAGSNPQQVTPAEPIAAGGAGAAVGAGSVAAVVARSAEVANPISKALKALGDLDALPPLADEFTPQHPTYMPAKDIETVKLTAQLTAAQGKAFLTQLTAREARNPAFDFLKPSHSAFLYFTTLVDQYHRILHPPAASLERLRQAGTSKSAVFVRCIRRLEQRKREDERKRSEAAAASQRSAAAFVDWHDFVIVETIPFDDDEMEEAAAGAGAGAGAALAPPARVVPTAVADSGEAIKVRTDYRPGSGAGAAAGPSITGYVDPRTGQQIPLEAASEHLRVDLLDPQWRRDQQIYQSRRQDSLFVAGADVAENLRALASKRTDVFADRSSDALGAGAAPAPKRPRLGDTGQ